MMFTLACDAMQCVGSFMARGHEFKLHLPLQWFKPYMASPVPTQLAELGFQQGRGGSAGEGQI